MRMKTYTAQTLPDAMEVVRSELGDDAIIISTQQSPDGLSVRVTAALEEENRDNDIETAIEGESYTKTGLIVRGALEYHNTPFGLLEKLVNLASSINAKEPYLALASALDEVFSFSQLFNSKQKKQRLILIGNPGAGKTSAVAKIAANARFNNEKIGVITADAVRAGAAEQLSAFTKILELELKKVRGIKSLKKAIEELEQDVDKIIIDSPGINPFSQPDLDFLKAMAETAKAEPIAVIQAGLDPFESADIAKALANVGAKKLLATRLDTARRLGGILSAAASAKLTFCEVSISPHVSDGFCNINPVSLAKLITPNKK